MKHAKHLASLLVMTVITIGWTPVFATSESLSFQKNIDGTYDAIVSGMHNGCEDQANYSFDTPYAISAAGNEITILSPYTTPGGCGLPPAAVPYQTITNLGHLTAGSYQVTWYVNTVALPVRTLAGTLLVGPTTAVGAPILNELGMAVLFFFIISLALWKAREQDDKS